MVRVVDPVEDAAPTVQLSADMGYMYAVNALGRSPRI